MAYIKPGNLRKELASLGGKEAIITIAQVADNHPEINNDYKLALRFLGLKGLQKFGRMEDYMNEQHGIMEKNQCGKPYAVSYFTASDALGQYSPIIHLNKEKFTCAILALGYKDLEDFGNKEGIRFTESKDKDWLENIRIDKTLTAKEEKPVKEDEPTKEDEVVKEEEPEKPAAKKRGNCKFSVVSKPSFLDHGKTMMHFVQLDYVEKDVEGKTLIGTVNASSQEHAERLQTELIYSLRKSERPDGIEGYKKFLTQWKIDHANEIGGSREKSA